MQTWRGNEKCASSSNELGGFNVAGNILPQRFERIDADRRQTGQFKLHKKRIGRMQRIGWEAVGHKTHRPAVAIILKPDQPFQYATIVQPPVDAGKGVPVAPDLPLRRKIELAQTVRYIAVETVAQIKHVARLRPVAGTEINLLRGPQVCVVLPSAVECPMVGDLAGNRRQNV